MELAINYNEQIKQAQMLNSIIEKMSSDEKFATMLIVSDDLKETLSSFDFDLNDEILKNFESSISKIKLSISKELSSLSDKVAEIVATVGSGNGTGGW